MEASLSKEPFDQIQYFFEYQADCQPDNVALICDSIMLSYKELDGRANQLANYLLHQGIVPGDLVVITLERSVQMYIAILAVLKAGAAYVPLEIDVPANRVNTVLSDVNPAALISGTQLNPQINTSAKIIQLDNLSVVLSQHSTARPAISLPPLKAENLCYIIYTSGSTGRPKGVEIMHGNVCLYIQSASQVYQVSSQDRIYQGFSIAFDASIEEIWMAWANGATLIASTSKEVRYGLGLLKFLNEHNVTVFSCVPSLLEELVDCEENLPDLRLLIFGGERCTAHLIKRYSRPGLRILNTYGPTEAAVVATVAECQVDQPVTIGYPLPGYEVMVLNEHMQPNEHGELYISGACLARGYRNQPELTNQYFIPHPNDKSRKLYRTGDMVAVNTDGALKYLGRMGDQVKLHGFRIELHEIETILLQYSGIKQAVVALQELPNHEPILVAYIVKDQKTPLVKDELRAFISQLLPYYMVPGLFVTLAELPKLANGKVDRLSLPKPHLEKDMPLAEADQPHTQEEKNIAVVWKNVFNQASISIRDNFFYDLGGHSLLAAKVVSLLRQQPHMQQMSILDLYQNPTIAQLAKKFPLLDAATQASEAIAAHQHNSVPHWRYSLCVIGQAFGCVFNFAIKAWEFLLIVLTYQYLSHVFPTSSLQFLATMLAIITALPLLMFVMAIVAKWLLLGRVKPGEYPLWGWFYWRWWLFQRIQHALINLQYLAGSPLMNLYCRLMGAKIGKNCCINSPYIGTFDLLCMGDNSSVNHEAVLMGAVVEKGLLKIGATTIGSRCYIGARSVIGHNASMADDVILEDLAMLPAGAHIFTGKYYHGSPARAGIEPAQFTQWKQSIPADNSSTGKNIGFGLLHYLGIFLMIFFETIAFIPAALLINHFYTEVGLIWAFCVTPIAAFIYKLFLCSIAVVVKKTVLGKLKARYCAVKSWQFLRIWTVALLLDIKSFEILGDSLYYPKFLRLLGAKIGRRVELGRLNNVAADLFTIQDESFAASGILLAAYKIYLGSVVFSPISIKKKAFIGNRMLMPGGTILGENCLLGCLTLPPLNGEAENPNTAWLGSPAVFLPKREIVSGFSSSETLYPSKKLYALRASIELIRIILPMTFIFISLIALFYLFDYLSQHYSKGQIFLLFPLAYILVLLSLSATGIGLKWLLVGRLKECVKPLWCIFIWKYDVIVYLFEDFFVPYVFEPILGTPFASTLLRAFGCKIGKRVFIDTLVFTEFDLIQIGDDTAINQGTAIQTHLYEDRIFKIAHIKIKNRCNIGCQSMVLYNTVMEDDSTLDHLSLLMKGETLPAHSAWKGVPAQSVIRPSYQIQEKISIRN